MFGLTLIALVVVVVHWRLTSARLKRIEERLAQSENLQRLTVRVYQLEQALRELRPAPSQQEPAPAPEPVPPPVNLEAPIAEPAQAPLITEPEPGPAAAPVPKRRSEDWETLVGGNLLNKIGALVLVIGLGLFLSYSFAHMTPAGRTMLALALSAALLLAGIYFERREQYRIFARGLIAGGWAGLYASAYAMYALDAARIIDDAFLGSIVLLAVAGGMIGHSLSYRVQGVTGLAYFTAFAALAATPATPFAVVALIPLATSLLYLAYRFEWYSMAVFGALATYATCISRGSSDAPLLSTESLFAAYWLLFEAFDILRARRRAHAAGVQWIFPLNTSGFLGLSYAAWSTKAPGDEWQMAAIAAAMYLASALLRAMLVQPSAEEIPAGRLRAGGYEAPLTVSAALAGLAIVGRVEGVWMGVGLALEAETLYLTGVRTGSRYVRLLGGAGFGFSLLRMTQYDLSGPGQSPLFSRMIYNWSPVAVFHAFLFYVNRLLRGHAAFTWGAAVLLAMVAAAETPAAFIGCALLVLSAVWFEIGFHKQLPEFRYQAYALAAVAVAASAVLHAEGTARPWIALAVSLAVLYTGTLRCLWAKAGHLFELERRILLWAGAGFTALLAHLLAWRLAQEGCVGLCWWALALFFFALGARKLPQELGLFCYTGALLATAAIYFEHVDGFVKFAPWPVWTSCAGAAIAAWTLAVLDRRRIIVRCASAAAGSVFALAYLWIALPDPLVAVAWITLGFALLSIGLHLHLADLRIQAAAIAALVLGRAVTSNMESVETIGSLAARAPTVAAVILALYAAQFLSPREAVNRLDRYARVYYSLLATSLVTLLLNAEVTGGWLTVAWGVQALLLLAAGFPLGERSLRLQGLALFLICILKLFVYDLRNLETPFRILSFVALGALLLGVSWVYTRFREQLRRHL